ncbi:hypothetical protein S83_066581, partial [Arachis hypogaea]
MIAKSTFNGLCLRRIRVIIVHSSSGPCKDINISAASLSQRTIYSVSTKQKWDNFYAKFQDGEHGVLRYATDASKDSQVLDYVSVFNPISEIRFEEFCAAAISVHQLEGIETWEHHARRAYELFEKDGNRPIMIEELAS